MSVADGDEQLPEWVKWFPNVIRRYLERNTTLRKVVSNTSWLMVERLVTLGIRFVVGVWVVRYLGPENYGIYSYAISFIALFQTLSVLGLEKIVIRALSREGTEDDAVIATVFWLRLAGGILAYSVVFGLVAAVEDDWITKLAVLIVGGRFLFDTAQVFDYWFQARIQSRYAVYARSAATILGAGAQVVCILLGLPVLAFLIVHLGQTAVTAVGLYVAIRSVSEFDLKWTFRPPQAKRFLADSWPLIVASFSTLVYMKIDQIMIRHMVGQEAVGVYAAAVKLSELWHFVPGALTASVYPEIVRLREEETEAKYRVQMQRLYDLVAGYAYAVALPITFIAPWLVQFLFGAGYGESGMILRVHVWALLFMSLGLARSKWIVAENMTQLAMVASVIGAVTNVGLNLVLIPSYAGLGAAIATLVSYSAYAYFAMLLHERARVAFRQMSRALVVPLRYSLRALRVLL